MPASYVSIGDVLILVSTVDESSWWCLLHWLIHALCRAPRICKAAGHTRHMWRI